MVTVGVGGMVAVAGIALGGVTVGEATKGINIPIGGMIRPSGFAMHHPYTYVISQSMRK